MSITQEKQLLDQKSPRHSFDRKGKVISVSSSQGGSGKTATSLLLGAVLATKKSTSQENLKVCVVDLDTFDGQVGFALNKTFPTSLNLALSNTPIDDEFLWENLVYSEHMGLHALLAPVRSVTAPYVDASFYANIIQRLRTMFDVVIIDTGSDINKATYSLHVLAYGVSDKSILINGFSSRSLSELDEWFTKALKHAPLGYELDMSKTHLVLQHNSQAQKGTLENYNGVLDGMSEWNQISRDDELMHKFFNENLSLAAFDSPLLDDIERIADTQILPLL